MSLQEHNIFNKKKTPLPLDNRFPAEIFYYDVQEMMGNVFIIGEGSWRISGFNLLKFCYKTAVTECPKLLEPT